MLDEVVHAACEILGLIGDPHYATTAQQFRAVATDYLDELAIEPLWGTPKQQRAAMRKLLKSLANTLTAMSAITPEYAVALDSLMDRDRGESPVPIFSETLERIIDLAFVVGRFDAEYRPNKGRPVDIPLEGAIRKLIDIVEPLTSEFPQVQLNKHSGQSPTLKSSGARAIGELLRGVHPNLEKATIARMIDKIRRQPRESESHLGALFRLDPDFELDCSLLRVARH